MRRRCYREEALALLDRVGMAAQTPTGPSSELAYGDVKRVELAIALAGAPQAAADGRADRRHGARASARS